MEHILKTNVVNLENKMPQLYLNVEDNWMIYS